MYGKALLFFCCCCQQRLKTWKCGGGEGCPLRRCQGRGARVGHPVSVSISDILNSLFWLIIPWPCIARHAKLSLVILGGGDDVGGKWQNYYWSSNMIFVISCGAMAARLTSNQKAVGSSPIWGMNGGGIKDSPWSWVRPPSRACLASLGFACVTQWSE